MLVSSAILGGLVRASASSIVGEVVVTPSLEGTILHSFPFLLAVVTEIEGAFEYLWSSHDPLEVAADLEAEASFLRLGNAANDGVPASVFGRTIGVAVLEGDLTVNLLAHDDAVLEPVAELFQTYNFIDEGDTRLLDVPAVVETQADEPLTLPFAVRSPPFALFDGTNFLERASSDSVLNPSAEFTVSVTFDPELTQPGDTCVVVSKHNSTDTQNGWLMEWNSSTGLATFTVYGNAAGTISKSRPTSSEIRVRSRVTAVVDSSGDIEVYVDGSSDQGSQTDVGVFVSPNASTEPFAIAADEPSNDGTNRMKGAVYDFAFWDTDLAQVDAEKLLPTGEMPTDLDTADLVVYFDGQDLLANQLSGFYASWTDSKASLVLTAANPTSFAQIPAYAPDSFTAEDSPPILSVQFHDATSLIDQSEAVDPDPTLQTTHALDNTARWRLWQAGSLTPQITSGFRSYRNDLTITILLSRVDGANLITLLQFYGILFEFQSVGGMRIIDGDDNVGSTNRLITYPSLGLPEGRVSPSGTTVPNASRRLFTLRWNAWTQDLDVFVNGLRVTLRTILTGQSAFERSLQLVLADFGDFNFVEIFPACLSDDQIERTLARILPPGYSSSPIPRTYGYMGSPFLTVDRIHRPFLDDQTLEPLLPPTTATTVSGNLFYASEGGIQPSSVTLTFPRDGGGTQSYSDDGAGAFTADPGAQPVSSSYISYAGLAATGQVVLSAQPSDGDTVSLVSADGTLTRTFEFESAVPDGVVGGNVAVSIGVDRDTTASNLRAAINLDVQLKVTAAGTAGDVDLTHDVPAKLADVTITVAGTNLSKTDFTTGRDAGEWSITITSGGQDFDTDPDLRGSAAYFWDSNGANPVAEEIDFDKIEILLTQVYLVDWSATSYRYADAPYIIKDGFDEDDETGGGDAFTDPQPTIVSVTADAAHVVTANANAGPTNAGDVVTWWEIELATSNEELILVADYFQPNNFGTNRNHIDTFQILAGQNLNEKRIRFVIQAVADGSQIWKSLFFRMLGEEFDNDPPTIINVPTPTPAPEVDPSELLTTEEREALVLARRARAATPITPQAENSRYKTTKVFEDVRGFELGLMAVLDDFYEIGDDFRTHQVRSQDIGFLDRIAVQFYGAGFEWAWWVIAYANNIVDPDLDMFEDQKLVVPRRTALQSFLARKPVTTLTTSE